MRRPVLSAIKVPTAVPAKSAANAGSKKGRWQGHVRNPVKSRKVFLIPLNIFAMSKTLVQLS